MPLLLNPHNSSSSCAKNPTHLLLINIASYFGKCDSKIVVDTSMMIIYEGDIPKIARPRPRWHESSTYGGRRQVN